MKTTLLASIFAMSALCSACAVQRQLQLMPRDSGKVYTGTLAGSGGSGTMSVTIDGVTFSGPAAVTQSNQSFGFYQTFGAGGSSMGFVQGGNGNVMVKAILSAPGDRGLRCDIVGDGNGNGSAICVDDAGRIFDAVIRR